MNIAMRVRIIKPSKLNLKHQTFKNINIVQRIRYAGGIKMDMSLIAETDSWLVLI